MENNQVQAITRTPSGPGSVFLRVQLARRLRGRISMSTRKELRFLGAQLRAVRFNTRQSNLLRLERRNKVRSDSPRNSNHPRHAIFLDNQNGFAAAINAVPPDTLCSITFAQNTTSNRRHVPSPNSPRTGQTICAFKMSPKRDNRLKLITLISCSEAIKKCSISPLKFG